MPKTYTYNVIHTFEFLKFVFLAFLVFCEFLRVHQLGLLQLLLLARVLQENQGCLNLVIFLFQIGWNTELSMKQGIWLAMSHVFQENQVCLHCVLFHFQIGWNTELSMKQGIGLADCVICLPGKSGLSPLYHIPPPDSMKIIQKPANVLMEKITFAALDLEEMTLVQGHDIILGHGQQLGEILSTFMSNELLHRHNFFNMHALWLKLRDMTLNEDRSTQFVYEQQLCEVSSLNCYPDPGTSKKLSLRNKGEWTVSLKALKCAQKI